MTTAPWVGRTVVYRILNDRGHCIYIGCTRSLEARIVNHHTTTNFAGEIARIQITLHPDREAALAFERAEIQRLRPRYNINGRGRRIFWTPVDYVEVIEQCEARIASGATWRTGSGTSPHDVGKLRAEFARRFPAIAQLFNASRVVAA